MRVDRRIRFEYATCGRRNFFNPERKSCGFKNIRIRLDGTSNSLVIHQVKTKEIITVKEVWIPGFN